MDIPRPNAARQRRRKRLIYASSALIVLAAITIGLSRLEPAAPSVDKAQIWMDTVQRGDLPLKVRGNGTLVPETIVWVPTISAGRVEKICVLPGAAVEADTILIELANPEVEQAAFDAEWQLKGAESELSNLKVQLQTQRLNLQASVASVNAGYNSATLDLEVNEELAKSGLIPQLTLRQSRAKAEELAKLLEIEQQRLNISAEAAESQLAVQTARVEQLRALLQLRRNQVESLKIAAGIEGVLQKLGDASTLQVGQQLPAGANVARVANPARLKAEIKIYETQAKDVVLGQRAQIDTRNGVVPGSVIRIDPAVQNGTVLVDVALEGPLPRGARPDLSVEGIIELDLLQDVIHVGKPVHGSADSSVGLFKVDANGRTAERVQVKLGRSSVSTIEILNGLEVGDQVILSDMTQWDAYDRIRLN
ncbi:MAG: HlyD family efflux transporter periplasmic adaptor subunit [Verrucomicrobia bacterium]|nr:HlyD family efflux transporter periplasmic adaptor subunit [Verrucomicrobiota bacterium]